MPATDARRERLLAWLRDPPGMAAVWKGLDTGTIMEASKLYAGNGRWDRCHSDLKALERQGLAHRLEGERPALWEASR